jgi:branched-chain amino acid transport system ATP-binding protein
MALLEIQAITKYFSGLAALKDVDIQIETGEIVGLVGPNGAGKTTMFNLVTGTFHPTRGKIIFKGEDITKLKPNQIAARGIVRTFQATNLFKLRSVWENVLIACHLGFNAGLLSVLANTPFARTEEEEMRQKALEIIEYMGLSAVQEEFAQNLSHGHQKILGVCLALAANGELLLMDEPAAGLSPEETITMMERIKGLRDKGLTILLVEHNMKAVMGTCDRVVVLNYGEKIAEGRPEEIQQNTDVIEAYLGVETDVT